MTVLVPNTNAMHCQVSLPRYAGVRCARIQGQTDIHTRCIVTRTTQRIHVSDYLVQHAANARRNGYVGRLCMALAIAPEGVIGQKGRFLRRVVANADILGPFSAQERDAKLGLTDPGAGR